MVTYGFTGLVNSAKIGFRYGHSLVTTNIRDRYRVSSHALDAGALSMFVALPALTRLLDLYAASP
jgi:hypothetical protein